MWVNQTLLAQAGWERPPATWAEFEQACTDVLANTGSRCYPYVESVPTFQAWLRSRGGRLLDPDGRQATFNSPAGVESLALLRRLESAGLAWRPGEPFGDYVAFANGQAAFSFSSTGNSPFYLDAYEGAVQNGVPPFDWYQTIIPQVDPGQPATGLYGASFFVVRGDPEQELRAWRLIRWFTEPQQTARWAATLQAMPVRLSALDHMSDTLAAHPFVAVQVGEILPYARPAPAVAASVDVNNLLYNAILSVTYGYTEPQIALDRAATEANRLLATEP
jgi:ABC-type glycerol-3-phosphate transport system substrate-binding protein